MIPTDEQAVARAEEDLPAGDLPEALADAPAVLDGAAPPPAARPPSLPSPFAAPVDAALARAAREAGRLTPEIEEAMRHDRESAERRADAEDADGGDP